MSNQINSLNQRIASLEQQLRASQAAEAESQKELARQQRQLRLLIDLGYITTRTDNALEALQQVVQFVCEYMQWPVGHVLLRDPKRADRMLSSEIWCNLLNLDIDDLRRMSAQTRIDADSGFIGEALTTGQPVWTVQALDHDPSGRFTSAGENGLRHALACPIRVQGETVAALEFLTREPIPQDAGTRETIRQLSVHLARLFGLQQATRVQALYSEQLERNAEQLSRLAHIGSHDLQEPLRKIELFMTRLRRTDGHLLSESGKQSLTKMTVATTRMSALIRDLLELIYVATDQWQLSEVRLDEMMQKVRDIRMRRELADDDEFSVDTLPTLWAEPEVTQQVFEELIDNAIQYRGADRPLNIRVSYREADDDECFEIRIRDNGIGFLPEYAEQIFKPFQLLQRHESEQHTGVGLALCRRAIERLGGTLTAHSEGPDTGACFTIRLPQAVTVHPDEVYVSGQASAAPLIRSSQPDAMPD